MTVAARHIDSRPVARRYLHTQRYLRRKRVFDVAFCVVMLVPVTVVGLLCALAVRLDSPGPVMFTQLRVGKDGRLFRMYKFRTMVNNAEELKASLAHLNVLPAPDFKIPNDPRITRMGRFLRKTSLDELPQFLNVLRGEMSIVGPRPTDFGLSVYDLWHCERLEIPPGITGLWQLEGRHVSTFDERLRLDVKYIEEMSLILDIRLILRTVLLCSRGPAHSAGWSDADITCARIREHLATSCCWWVLRARKLRTASRRADPTSGFSTAMAALAMAAAMFASPAVRFSCSSCCTWPTD